MTNDLIPVDINQDDTSILALTTSTFLPRLQLFGGNSVACKEETIDIGHYGLVRDKDSIDDLTKEVDILICAARTKALEIANDNIITVFDCNSTEFKRIQTNSEVKDSGCMFGPEFLVWIFSQEEFATYFMASKTARREGKSVYGLLRKAATLKSKLIKTQKYSWHGPVVTPCSTEYNIPPLDIITSEIEKFKNPPAPTGPELAEAQTSREV